MKRRSKWRKRTEKRGRRWEETRGKKEEEEEEEEGGGIVEEEETMNKGEGISEKSVERPGQNGRLFICIEE